MTRVKALLACVAIALFSHSASAQQFPAKPVKVITPFSAGSGPDALLRILGDKLSRAWGQQVVVENRPGANGFIAIQAAKNAPADGYTLVQMDNYHLAAHPHLFKQLPYDPAKDFVGVSSLFRTYFFVVVPASSNWKNIPDMIAAAKAKPDALTYGSWHIGSPGHLGAALFEALTATQMTHVPFKEMMQIYTAVGNADIDWAFGSAASAGPAYRAGKVKFLAAAAPRRATAFPSVPTMAEAGGPADFEVQAWAALLAPRGAPANITTKIHQDVAKALAEPDMREKLAAFGFEPLSMD
jgi:tripartite-type tricarboxylate transporter receptor subunit TctC